jgi:hypothetical protein
LAIVELVLGMPLHAGVWLILCSVWDAVNVSRIESIANFDDPAEATRRLSCGEDSVQAGESLDERMMTSYGNSMSNLHGLRDMALHPLGGP